MSSNDGNKNGFLNPEQPRGSDIAGNIQKYDRQGPESDESHFRTPEELQKHLCWRQQEGLAIAPSQQLQNEQYKAMIGQLNEKKQILLKHAPAQQIDGLKDKVHLMMMQDTLIRHNNSPNELAQASEQELNQHQKQSHSQDFEVVINQNASEIQIDHQHFEREEQQQQPDQLIAKQIEDDDTQEGNDGGTISSQELELMENKVVNYILFLESQFYQQDHQQREESMKKTIENREQMRKQVLIMEMHKIREQCYDIYTAFNPDKQLPKEQIDEAVKQIMTRFHNYTKLNQIDLQNSVTLFQYNLKHNKFNVDPLDVDSNSPEAINLQQKWDLLQDKKKLEKSYEASSSNNTSSAEQDGKMAELAQAARAYLEGANSNHPEMTQTTSQNPMQISEEQLVDAMKFEGMPQILYVYKEKIMATKALLQQKHSKLGVYSSEMVDPGKMMEARKEIADLEERVSILTSEMYQVIDNMGFLSQLLSKLKSGLKMQLDHEEKRFLQRLVKAKASQVFQALDQINTNLNIESSQA